MEDVAKDNLEQLINRSLIQIEKRCWGRRTACRVHDLLRDLAIQKAKELNFFHLYDQIETSTCSSNMQSCRRQAAYLQIEDLPLQRFNPISRSLLLFNQKWVGRFGIMEQFEPLCARFTLLRVLDIECAEFIGTRWWRSNSLPEEIGNLLNLKYLGLRNSCIRDLPSSILRLQRLQTLDLFSVTGSIELPTEICKLQELRHLIGNFQGRLRIENMTNLQTLKHVEFGSWTEVNPHNLVNLRELRIAPSSMKKEKFTFNSIAELKNLQLLSVRLSVDSFASLQPLSYCRRLVDLRLSGMIKKLPADMNELLPNLECLSLVKSNLKEDPMPILEKMSNLINLYLGLGFYCGKKLTCAAKGFPRLEILYLYELEEWQIEEGAMPLLRGLRIPENSKFKIPRRLRSIPIPSEWECQDDFSDLFHYPL